MIRLGSMEADSGLLRERLLAALIRSQCAIADLLDHTAELRRSLPLADDELADQQKSAASFLAAQLQQAMGAALAANTRTTRENGSRGSSVRAVRAHRLPASPWLAASVYRGSS